eukprot:SAG25_NODE_92_length_16062_cov_54.931095_4_plen_115_part_00
MHSTRHSALTAPTRARCAPTRTRGKSQRRPSGTRSCTATAAIIIMPAGGVSQSVVTAHPSSVRQRQGEGSCSVICGSVTPAAVGTACSGGSSTRNTWFSIPCTNCPGRFHSVIS